MVYLGIFFYLASFIFQSLAALFALVFSGKAKGHHRIGWLFFSTALLLMLGRRISPIMAALRDLQVNITDAALSVPISLLLMLGVLSLRGLLQELEEKTQQLIATQKLDFLTCAVNRAELSVMGEKEVERSCRTRRTFAVLMLDIDHFKDVNDRYGHHLGDEVLKSLTCICQNTLRRIDIFGRYGGEEFVVILPETTLANAKEVAERLRKNVSDHLAVSVGLQDKAITISLGVAVFDPSANASQERVALFNVLIEQADMAMYYAKNAGRNQVSVFEYSMELDLNQGR